MMSKLTNEQREQINQLRVAFDKAFSNLTIEEKKELISDFINDDEHDEHEKLKSDWMPWQAFGDFYPETRVDAELRSGQLMTNSRISDFRWGISDPSKDTYEYDILAFRVAD